ncbi:MULTISPECIES: hypothetical protein [Stenotrophomonas]|uniref:Uncharacterized protein n=1 Tax=Stenotrophomonas maltophilia (strain R551-3) TaxID=391008 RepID=B4SS52_STRM5|nr:hypothetical protein [Stenotrophomonas maltophilia]ACF51291.1 hypothetical protein Smal_1586 [Stenotrophomonas maltophilia R551-3]PJL06911.1 hypothetical protein B9Y63_06865 [Stenotrophomonas maltophilia]TIE18296.1 hypothetical protein DI034_07985 [Stenotrophomonas maltophilia]TIE59190.1 hypothetical protein DI041_12440 [Stenotrophomonas maltophilia]BBO51305.1 hypothetical protein KMM349_16360 [Stenotrophomonas maltophilia]
MRDLNELEVAEISGGVRIQIGPSNGTHVTGTLNDFGNAAYMYGRIAPFSGIGAAGLIYHYIMAR